MAAEGRIAAPSPIERARPHPFPLIATIAPVLVSVLIWVVTRSPFALVFAALGPAVAVASVADARVQARRTARTERARFDRELASARAETVAFHERERRELDLDAPSAAARLGRGDHDPERWASTVANVTVTIGRGRRASAAALDVPVTRGAEAAQLAELARFGAELDDAALSVAAASGIAVVGPVALAAPVARGIVAQLAALLPPASVAIVLGAPPTPDHWIRGLPHRLVVDASVRDGEAVFRSGEEQLVVAVAATIDGVRSGARVVLRVGASAELVRHPDRSACGPVVVEYVSREQAGVWALRLAALAEAAVTEEAAPPDVVELAPILAAARPGERSTLAAAIGVGAHGAQTVDLVRDGPHAIVGGTTGSGKSELLIAWVLALAASYPPSLVTFLLVDFKGGASFAPLEALPHCVGVISDLDEREAVRAIESLRAEIRERERALAAAGVRSVDELADAIPRLVIVVDEFAAMVNDYPDLHAVFSDLAARGRSLGLHLVLCTQRPAGVVRDSVLANAGLRISLRVNNRPDSQAVIGTDVAAQLPASPRGRALVSAAGETPREVQVPLATAEDAAAVAARWPSEPTPRRPWRDPLPTVVPAASLDSVEDIAFGRSDHPHEQAQPTAAWRPSHDGHVLVVGGARSGKSTFLRRIAVAAGAAPVPVDPERAWDAVVDTLAGIRRGRRGQRLLLLDDVDATLARFSDEHADAFVDALTSVLREGPSAGVHVVLTVQRLVPATHALEALCDDRLLLRMPTKQDHVLAGGAADQFDAAAPAGRGSWRGHPVQVAFEESGIDPVAAEPPVERIDGGLAVVTTTPRAFAERATARGASVVSLGAVPIGADPTALTISPTVVVGDPDAWQAHWGALQSINETTPVLFDGCTLADYRMLTRSRTLPPPIVTSVGAGWLLKPDGTAARARY